MSATLALHLEQLKLLIGQCAIEEKVELIRYLVSERKQRYEQKM